VNALVISPFTRTVGLRCLVAAAASNCASSALMWMQPLLFQYFVTRRGLNEAAAGWVMTAEMGAMAVASMAFARFTPRRYTQRMALSGVVLATLASFLTLYIQSYWPFVIGRVVVGVGLGATVMISNVIAANFPDPTKVYARVGCANLLFGAALVAAFSLTTSVLPSATPYTTLVAALILLTPLMALLPRFSEFDHVGETPIVSQTGSPVSRSVARHTFVLVACTFSVITCSGIMWGFYGLIGQQTGLSAQAVDAAISVSIFTAFIGTGLPAVLGSSLGRTVPFCFALVLLSSAILVLTAQPTPLTFRIAVCVNVGAIYLLLPYLASAAVALDGGGKAAAYVSSAFFFGSAAAPFIGGVLATTVGIAFIGKLVLVLSVVVAITFAYVERQTAARATPIVVGIMSAHSEQTL
jgi:predicted MFS family arabinose efflux permease